MRYKTILAAALLCLALGLAGCGKPLRFENGLVLAGEEVTVVLEAGETARLDEIEGLRRADLRGSTCYAEILAWAQAHPEVAVRYSVALPGGAVENNAVRVELAGVEPRLIVEAAPLFAYLPALESVDLGADSATLTWAQLGEICAALPELRVDYAFTLGGRRVSLHDTALELSGAAAAELETILGAASQMPELQTIALGNDPALGWDAVRELREALPALRFTGGVTIGGRVLALDSTALDLSALARADVEKLAAALPCMTALETVSLGDESGALGWAEIGRLQDAAPQAAFSYAFTLFGQSCDLTDTEWKFKQLEMNDGGAAVRAVLPYMKQLRYLRMDRCGVESADMAALRDDFPEIKVVWRVMFGKNYSALTDATKILASQSSVGGCLTVENCAELQYCTDVKYLDIGHQKYLRAVPFCATMPELEILVVSIGALNDISGLANCQKLRILEMYQTEVSDISPLGGLRGLTDLNIGWNYKIKDVSPLLSLAQLEYVMVGATSAPKEQVAQLKETLPNCEVNDWSYNGKTGWRGMNDENGDYVPSERYLLIRQVFNYDERDYAYYWKDPEW